MPTRKQKAMSTLNDWLRQPARGWEVIEAEATGLSVLGLRERFLRVVNAELQGVANDYVN